MRPPVQSHPVVARPAPFPTPCLTRSPTADQHQQTVPAKRWPAARDLQTRTQPAALLRDLTAV